MHEKETRNRQKEAIIDLQTKTCSVIMEKMNKNILLMRQKWQNMAIPVLAVTEERAGYA